MKSIQTKILFVVIAGLVVITALVSAIAVNMTHTVMHRDADRILQNAAQHEAAKINDTLGDVVKSCGIMAHYATTEAGDAEQLKNAEFYAAYMEKMETMLAEIALNTNGVQGFFFRIDPAYGGNTAGFYKLVKVDGSLKSMPVTDLSKYDKSDKQNVGWYYEAVNAGTGVWMDPYVFPGNEGELITFAQPLYLGGNLFGVVGFDMDFSYLCRRIEEISVYQRGYAVLLATDGKTPYTESEISHSHNPHTENKVELKNGMYLELCADYKDIQREIHPMLGRIVMAFLAVLAGAILYTLIVTHKIVAPLKRLTASAQAISSGEVVSAKSEVLEETNDEIGTLARVLNEAYAKIQEYTSHINALAYRDSLTGIKNTTAYAEAIRDLNKDICTGNPSFGVLVADINNLKETNDAFGHDVGNDLIVHTARILTETFKSSVIFRIGGDEFAVLLRGEDCNRHLELLRQLDASCDADYINVGNKIIHVSVARGVSLFDPNIDHVYEDVFAKADHAMYIDKQTYKTTEQHEV